MTNGCCVALLVVRAKVNKYVRFKGLHITLVNANAGAVGTKHWAREYGSGGSSSTGGARYECSTLDPWYCVIVTV